MARRTLFALCVSSLVACIDNSQATFDPDDAGTSDGARGPDAASDARADVISEVTGLDSTPSDAARADVLATDAPTADAATADATGVDGAAPDAARVCESRERCDNGLDDDCDGVVDDGCVCVPGATQRCYPGAPGVAGRGACVWGMTRCEGSGEFGRWTPCEGAVSPAVETCDGVDNDCDGVVDEGFCRVADACARNGAVNPANVCQVCVAPDGAPAATAWTARPSGTPCRPTAGACDVAETCAAGVCPADAFYPSTGVCRPAVGACDAPEACTGSSADCPSDARRPAMTVCRPAAGACDVAESCDGAGADCPSDALAPSTTPCRASASIAACDPAETCTGRDPACPPDVVTRVPRAEVCGNSVDDNCNGMIDEGCAPPCIMGMASSSPWQMHRAMGPVCFGRTFSQHGDPGEYAFAAVPAQGDAAWRAVTSATIDFAESSALCGRACSCSDGGEFTYFQTFFDVSPGFVVSTLTVTMAGVDDGARVTVYNSTYPTGIVDAGSYILLGGTGVSTNLARYIVAGRNRVVITHIDDCCSDRSLTGVRVVLNGAALMTCR